MMMLNGGKPAPNPLALEVVNYRILGKPYSKWRKIIAETGESDTAFLIGLKMLHGLNIQKDSDPFLFIVQDTQTMRHLKEDGVPNPTMLQILLTTRVIDVDQDRAKERFERLLKED